jgi:hypothetical protein
MIEKPDKLTLVVCKNSADHLDGDEGVATLLTMALVFNGDMYSYPPQDFINELIERFRARNGGGLILIAHDTCYICQGKDFPSFKNPRRKR